MRFYEVVLFRIFFILFLVLFAPAGATPFPMLIGGQVTGLNETDHILTINTECDRFVCDRMMPGAYEGTVTNDAVFTTLQPGDRVALMYKSWLGQYPCDMGGYKDKCTIPGHGPIPVGQWAGISRVVQEPGTSRWLTTDLFGDPQEGQVQLIHNYSLEYETGPDPAKCPLNEPVWECNAGYVNISILHNNSTVTEARVLRNTTFVYEDPHEKTNITLLFLGGTATPHHIVSPGGAPYADMEVHVQPTPVRPVPDSFSLPGSPEPSSTQPTPFPFFIALLALCIAGIGIRMRL
jgi:hypothetical protein